MKFSLVIIIYSLAVPEVELRRYPKLENTAVLTTLNITLTQNLSLPLHADSYPELMEKSDIIVDKSLFIEEILESMEIVHVISCPSQWGKSMNLNMLKSFLEIKVDKYGDIMDHESTANYRLFKNGEIVKINETKVLQLPLKISKKRKLFNNYQGKYPVIYLNFEMDTPLNYRSFMLQMKGAVAKTYLQHQYLKRTLQNELVNTANRRLYNTTSELEVADRSFDMFLWEWDFVDGEMLSSSLLFLCKLLYRYFGRKPIILFDGYDKPLNAMLVHGDFKEKTKLTDFLVKLFRTTFVENACYTKAVIAGVLTIAKEDLFPNSSEIVYHNYLQDDPIFEYFGFSEGEVGLIFDKVGVSGESYRNACHYYLGYRSGEFYDLNITNMLSVSTYLKNRELDDYWYPRTTFVEDLLIKLLNDDDLRMKLIRLIYRDTTELDSSSMYFRINEYFDLSHLTRKFAPLTFSFKDPARKGLKFLAGLGYLTPIPPETNTSSSRIKYRIANEEVRNSLLNLLRGYFAIMLDLNNRYKDIIYTDFQNEFKFYLINVNSIYNHTTLPEDFKTAVEHLSDFFQKPMTRIKLDHGQIRCTESGARVIFDFALIEALYKLPYVEFLDRYPERGSRHSRIPSVVMYDKHQNGMVMQYRFDKKYKSEMLEECKYYVRYFHQRNCTWVKLVKLTEVYLLPNDVAEIRSFWFNRTTYKTYYESLNNNSGVNI